jgi:hypothetical protein
MGLEYLRLPQTVAEGGGATIVAMSGRVEHAQHEGLGVSDARLFLARQIGVVPGGQGRDVVHGEGFVAAAISAPDGAFALAAPPGTYELLVWRRDFRPRVVQVGLPGRVPLVVRLRPAPEQAHVGWTWRTAPSPVEAAPAQVAGSRSASGSTVARPGRRRATPAATRSGPHVAKRPPQDAGAGSGR